MSTRACYVFTPHPTDAHDPTFTVYRHFDGYPSGATAFLNKSLPLAWPLPRYENDQFASAFIAANQGNTPGGIRLTTSPEAHGDLAWVYRVAFNTQALIVTAWGNGEYPSDGLADFHGTLDEFSEWSKTVGPQYSEDPPLVDQLWTALAEVMPYALSRCEDMHEETERTEGTEHGPENQRCYTEAAAKFERANQLFITHGRPEAF